MKKLMLGFCLLLGSAVATYAQDTRPADQDQQPTQHDQDQGKEDYQEKEVITVDDLPQRVRDQVQGQDYTGWTVNKAYRKVKDGKTVYAVELSQGSEKKIVKFDAEGNKLKEKKKD